MYQHSAPHFVGIPVGLHLVLISQTMLMLTCLTSTSHFAGYDEIEAASETAAFVEAAERSQHVLAIAQVLMLDKPAQQGKDSATNNNFITVCC